VAKTKEDNMKTLNNSVTQSEVEWRQLQQARLSVGPDAAWPGCVGIAWMLRGQPAAIELKNELVLVHRRDLSWLTMSYVPARRMGFPSGAPNFWWAAVERAWLSNGALRIGGRQPWLGWGHQYLPGGSARLALDAAAHPQEYDLANAVMRTMLSSACNRLPGYRRANPPADGLYFGEDRTSYPLQDVPPASACFPVPYVALDADVDLDALLDSAFDGRERPCEFAATLPQAGLRESLCADLAAGLPVRSPFAGTYLGLVPPPPGCPTERRRHCRFHAFKLTDGSTRLLRLFHKTELQRRPGEPVRLGDELGYETPLLAEDWQQLSSPEQFVSLYSDAWFSPRNQRYYGLPETELAQLIRNWFTRQALYQGGRLFIPYQLIATAMTRPGGCPAVRGIYFNIVNTSIDTFNERLNAGILPAIPQPAPLAWRFNFQGINLDFEPQVGDYQSYRSYLQSTPRPWRHDRRR
jgi:hypothetical protein